MSQNTRSEPGERKEQSERPRSGQERSKYEGFEGMNYEQIRQPFQPRKSDKEENGNREQGQNGRP